MKNHMVLTTAIATAAATTGTAATALAGDSLTTRNYGKEPKIISIWGTLQTAGFGQLAFPTGHDTTRGCRTGSPAASTQVLLPIGAYIPITPQETIAATIGATAVAGDVEQLSWLTAYDIDKGQRLIDWAECNRRLKKVTTIEASLVSVLSTYGPAGGELVTADSDLLIANRDYALLGATCRTQVHCIAVAGPDTGNDKIGVPGALRYEVGAQWFKLLSNALGMPLIPVINSGNKGSTTIFVSADENAGTFVVTLHLALLD
jgi:hypothetical protein